MATKLIFEGKTKSVESARPRVQSVARAASILQTIAQSDDGLSTNEISAQVAITRQVTYHLLHTLNATGLVSRNARGRYVLGLRVGVLGEAFRHQLDVPEHLAPIVRAVAQTTGETAYAVGWWNGEIVALSAARGHKAVLAADVPVGFAGDAHARASGKLLLAYASKTRLHDYLSTHALSPRTRNTITDQDRLRAELEKIRKAGYATDLEEFVPGVCCLAVPVVEAGRASHAIGLSAPVERFQKLFRSYVKQMNATIARRIQQG